MNIKELLELKYPEACEAGLIRCNNKDNSDENGWRIGTWEIDEPKPTLATLNEWKTEYAAAFEEKRRVYLFNKLNKALLDQLDEIDRKTIRALRENDQERLAELNTQAELIRQQFTEV